MNDVNREVAEKVMGWRLDFNPFVAYMWVDGNRCTGFKEKDFDPMHRIEHAIMALEKFVAWDIKCRIDDETYKKWYVCDIWNGTNWYESNLKADTAPEAICLASLKAKEGEHE